MKCLHFRAVGSLSYWIRIREENGSGSLMGRCCCWTCTLALGLPVSITGEFRSIKFSSKSKFMRNLFKSLCLQMTNNTNQINTWFSVFVIRIHLIRLASNRNTAIAFIAAIFLGYSDSSLSCFLLNEGRRGHWFFAAFFYLWLIFRTGLTMGLKWKRCESKIVVIGGQALDWHVHTVHGVIA